MKIKFSTPRWIHCVRAFLLTGRRTPENPILSGYADDGSRISTSHAPVFSTCQGMPRELVEFQAEYAKKFSAGDTGQGPPAFPVQDTPKDAVAFLNHDGGVYWRAADGRTFWTPPKP